MFHHNRLTNPAYFTAFGYCHPHGVYACISCLDAPVDESEVTESKAYKALEAENAQLRASTAAARKAAANASTGGRTAAPKAAAPSTSHLRAIVSRLIG